MSSKDKWLVLTSTAWQDFYRGNEWVGLTEVDKVHQVILQGLISINRIIKEISIYNKKTYFDLFQGITELESLLTALFDNENSFLINHDYQDSDKHMRQHYHIIKELNKILLDDRMMVKYSINLFFDNIVPLIVSHFDYDLSYYNISAVLGSKRRNKGQQGLILPRFYIASIDGLVKNSISQILASLKKSHTHDQETLVELIKVGLKSFYVDLLPMVEPVIGHYKASLIQKDKLSFDSISLEQNNKKQIYQLLIGEWIKKLFYYKSTLLNRYEWLLGLLNKGKITEGKELFHLDTVGNQFILRLIDIYVDDSIDSQSSLPLLVEEIQNYISNRYLSMDESIEMQPFELEMLQQNMDTLNLYIEQKRLVDKKILIEKILKTIIYQFEDFKVVINET